MELVVDDFDRSEETTKDFCPLWSRKGVINGPPTCYRSEPPGFIIQVQPYFPYLTHLTVKEIKKKSNLVASSVSEV